MQVGWALGWSSRLRPFFKTNFQNRKGRKNLYLHNVADQYKRGNYKGLNADK
jgi:hypothetical protein